MQLAAILRSSGFINSERMKRFLEFIVEETLAGRGSELCEYSIGISVFDRGESFEPGLNPIVRNDARRLRNKLLEYYQQAKHAQEGEVIIEVPKGGYMPVFRLGSIAARQRSTAEYRLHVKLIRITDNQELIAKVFDLEGEKCSLHFELENPKALPFTRLQRPPSSISALSSAAVPLPLE